MATKRSHRSQWNPSSWSPTDWAGVLGFALALVLGTVEIYDRWQSRAPSIRLGEITFGRPTGRTPFGPSDYVFKVPLYHEGGPSLRVEELRFVAPLDSPGSSWPSGSGMGSGAAAGWGSGRSWSATRDRLESRCFVCWDSRCQTLGDMQEMAFEEFPVFEAGETLLCTADFPLGRISFSSPDGVRFELWAQGRVQRSFDVTSVVKDAHDRYASK